MVDLTGQVVLNYGGSRGLGRAFAQALLDESGGSGVTDQTLDHRDHDDHQQIIGAQVQCVRLTNHTVYGDLEIQRLMAVNFEPLHAKVVINAGNRRSCRFGCHSRTASRSPGLSLTSWCA
jgi:NAD(P)-dependent dehydrogenase (short-subunit alcohol dehydrogenase family)